MAAGKRAKDLLMINRTKVIGWDAVEEASTQSVSVGADDDNNDGNDEKE